MSVLTENLKHEWEQNGYTDDQIAEAVNCIERNRDSAEDSWVKIPDIGFLDCATEYMHRAYVSELDPGRNRVAVKADIEMGITFGLWEEEGVLLWER